MSAIAGVFGPGAQSSTAALRDMLAAMRHRAAGNPEEFHSSGAQVLVARHEWEEEAGGWSGPLLAENEEWVVAADAALYYVADLRRELRAPRSATSAELVLLSLRRWGPRFSSHLEGDYAILAWERRRNRLLLARDFGGRRSLAYSMTGQSIVVASSPTVVVRHPDVSADYDVAFVGLSAGGAVAHGARTAFRNVAVVPGGVTLSFEDGTLSEVNRWTPPPFGSAWEPALSHSGAEELRALLESATTERLATTGPTTVFMSGGWDSTSVFASGMAALSRNHHAAQRLLPVSMTYPPDDSGNEEGFIRAVAQRWDVPVRWIDAERIPLFAGSERLTALRDDPMPQAFESQIRTMSQVSRELGSRVALDGFGGDHIFHLSSISVIADHLFYGRWPMLWDSWRSWGDSNRQFVRACLLPHLTPAMLDWIAAVRGRSLKGFWDRGLPSWIIASPTMLSQLTPEFERLPGEGAAEYEARVAINSSLVPRAVSWNIAFGLDEGVQLRAPLFDPRVIAFAAARPLSDRGSGGDSKRLLRLAMSGLIPDEVLGPRSRKTGTPVGYFNRQLATSLSWEVSQLFAQGRSNLEQMGLLDRTLFDAAVSEYARAGGHGLGSALHLTLESERWLAARSSGALV